MSTFKDGTPAWIQSSFMEILKSAGVPDGYRREFVVIKDKPYRYCEDPKTGNINLFNMKDDKIPDGSLIIEKCIPRLYFKFNKIIFIDLLIKNVS